MAKPEDNWPSIAQLFSQVILPQVTVTDKTTGEGFIKQGALIFSVGTWMFENGALLGYGLKDQPVLTTKLLGIPGENTGEFLQDYLKNLAADLLNTEDVSDTTTLTDLFLIPTLLRAGYTVSPDAEWMKIEVTDQDAIWNFIQVACQQGVGIGFHFPDTFVTCWRNSYQPDKPGTEEYETAQQAGILEILQQEDRILEDEVKKTLTGASKWVEKVTDFYFTADEAATIRKLSEQ